MISQAKSFFIAIWAEALLHGACVQLSAICSESGYPLMTSQESIQYSRELPFFFSCKSSSSSPNTQNLLNIWGSVGAANEKAPRRNTRFPITP